MEEDGMKKKDLVNGGGGIISGANGGIEEAVSSSSGPKKGDEKKLKLVEGATATTSEESSTKTKDDDHKIAFPPPCSWYRSSVAASRDDMWAYCAGGVIVLVHPSAGSSVSSTAASDGEKATLTEPTASESSELKPAAVLIGERRKRWPKFSVLGSQMERYSAISFCQSSWEYLPVRNAPLVSACERGIVRIWNVEDKSTVLYHDYHKEAKSTVTGLDWSPKDHSMIYAIDEKGNLSVWNVSTNSIRILNFGKHVPNCLRASPYEKNVIAIGTKGGNVVIVDVTDTSGKIVAKVRHEEEVSVVAWVPPQGEWETASLLAKEKKTMLPMLVSCIQSMKLPTIRVWNTRGQDIGTLQAWERDTKTRAFKVFGCAAFVKDPSSGNISLVSSGKKGEIVMWDKLTHEVIHHVHTHNAIFSMIQCGDILWSFSYEPILVGWNLRTSEVECVIPTLKGICAMYPSPVESSRLAIAGSDSVIRVLKCESGYPEDVDTCSRPPMTSQRLRGKITALAWHPTRDNYIGFGTDEGVLGTYEVRENNKVCMTFDARMRGTIYTVAFGPSACVQGFVPTSRTGKDQRDMEASTEPEKEGMKLYACGGSQIFMINPSRSSNALINVSQIIKTSNQLSAADEGGMRFAASSDKATEINWSPDFSLFAVGYHDGRIELYTAPNLKLACWIKCHLQAIQYLVWRPYDFDSPNADSNTRWLASTSNDGTARLYNLAFLFEKGANEGEGEDGQEGKGKAPHMLISSECQFQAHLPLRVISCAWSPHEKNLFVTVSYDCTAIVWNIEDGSHIARYMNHQHRLVSCCFHPTDRFKVITASDEQTVDLSLHVWDYREHPFRHPTPRGPGCKPSQPIKVAVNTLPTLAPNAKCVMDVPEVLNIKEQTFGKSAGGKAHLSANKKQKLKTPLPLTSNGLINGKCSITKEFEILSGTASSSGTSAAGTTGDANAPEVYLGILQSSLDCKKLLQFELDHHESKKSQDEAVIISTWMGETKAIEKAINEKQVSEFMLPIAALKSRKLFTEAVLIYAGQLVNQEEYTRASTFYLLLGKIDLAVTTLVERGLYREAVALLKSHLPEDEGKKPIDELCQKWAERAVGDGNFELAAKIFFSMGKYAAALSTIEKRPHPYAFEAGCYLSNILGDKVQIDLFGVKFILDANVRAAHTESYDLIKKYPDLKWLLPMVRIHEALIKSKHVFRSEQEFSALESGMIHVMEEVVLGLKEEKLEDCAQKINSNILVSIAQNGSDALHMIVKNLSLLILGAESLEETAFYQKGTDAIKLADAWFLQNDVPLYAAIVSCTWYFVTKLGKKGGVEMEGDKAGCNKDSLQRIEQGYVDAMKILQSHLNQERAKIEDKIKTSLELDKSVVKDLNGHD